jgi:ABC-type multidrug transport system ATPase subunit
VVPFADRVALLTGDGSVRVGSPGEILADSPVVPPLVELGRIAGWSPLPLTVREARRQVRDLDVLDPPSPRPVPAGEPALVARGVRVVHGRVTAVADVDLTLASGEVVALMGRNGSGKSSLLWALQGRTRTAGRVDVHGADPVDSSAARRRDLVGLVPQTAADLLYLETVAEECAAAGPGCRELLESLVPGVPGGAHPRDLSEGQRLALALAIVLISDPPVLLLDEPTRGLDYPAKRALAEVLRGLTARGKAVLVSTHDVEWVAQVADRVVVLAEGEVVSSGPVREVIAQSPAYAPQVTKVLGLPWLTPDEVRLP